MVSTDRFYKLALLGYPVSHSLSPLMHRAALSFCGLQGSYELLSVPPERLCEAVVELRQSGFAGFNVTVPHKQAVMPCLDELTPEAQRVKAVNTVAISADGRRLVGHNTDLGGFLQAVTPLLADPFTRRQQTACLLGAGGAARAALWALAQLRFGELAIVARNTAQAEEMLLEAVTYCSEHSTSALPKMTIYATTDEGIVQLQPDLIVNSTRIGLGENTLPDWLLALGKQAFPQAALYDMVYAGVGKTTPLVQYARQLGAAGFDGLEMLIEQAALAFRFWTGVPVPAAVMREALSAEQKSGC